MNDLLTKGGLLMWPLLFCSMFSLAITLERLVFWWKEKRYKNDRLLESLLDQTEKGNFRETIESAHSGLEKKAELGFAIRILIAGLKRHGYGFKENMELAAEDEIEQMKRGMGVLDTIITMAPLLGILGTVLGIIDSFDLMGQSGLQDPRAVTGGIAQALITTAVGLSVALISLVPFNYFVGKIQKATKEINRVIVHADAIYQKGLEAKQR